MPIQSPENNIPLDQATQQALEQGKNQVTLLQVESVRLARLKSQIEKDIGNLNAQKIEVDNSVKIIKTESNKVSSELTATKDALQITLKQLSDTKTEESTLRQSMIVLNKDLADKRAGLIADRTQFDQQKTKLTESIKNHEIDKQDLAQKKAILADTINKI